jgi:glycosyltransferase involved in cell wall biosynthesis
MTTQLQRGVEGTNKVNISSHPRKVSMHVLTTFRTDPRVMRSAIALKEAGYAVSVIDIVDQCVQATAEEIHGISVKHIKVSNTFVRNRFRRWVTIKVLLLSIRSTLLLLQTPADIYHAHDFTGLPACYVAALLHRRPLIFDAHELPLSELDAPNRRRLRFFLRPLLTHMIASCAGGIGASLYYAQVLREQYHIPEVALVRNMPTYRLARKNNLLRERFGLAPSVRIALYQGNIQAHRGLDVLVRAAAFLEKDIVIVLLGKWVEPTISELQALLISERVADRLKILPALPYEELLDWTASADIGLSIIPLDSTLNKQTCLPNKFFEYVMMGLPVLTSTLEATSELIQKYDIGALVPSLAPEDIADTLNATLQDAARLARMRLNALLVAQQEFNWEKEKASLVDLYQSLFTKDDDRKR